MGGEKESNGKTKSIGTIVGIFLQMITVLVIPYLVWVTTSIYDLREWRCLSMKINSDQDVKIFDTEKGIQAVIDKMVPVALTTQVGELRTDVKNLEKTVNELSGILREHTRFEKRTVP